MVSSSIIQAQSYRFSPYPDLWYNDVDGIRFGLRVLGEVEGTFKDGAHRLDAGVWLGSKLPENPVSYYLSFTEPIPGFSDFGSEGNVQVISSSRTGFAIHQLSLNKRWQKGFDELDYLEGSLSLRNQKLYNNEYAIYQSLWKTEWVRIFEGNFSISQNSDRSQFYSDFIFQYNFKENTESFSVATIELIYSFKASKNFTLRLRNFIGLASEEANNEFKFLTTNGSPISWLSNGFTRANGVIPSTQLNNGLFHIGGGANLRGYQNQMAGILKIAEGAAIVPVEFPLHNKSIGFNLDLEFPNPINKYLKTSTYIGDFFDFRSYSFFDTGMGVGTTVVYNIRSANIPDIVPPKVESVFESGKWLMDAGLGFQLSANIPDYLGKDRGIFIRYDIPFWLSSPRNNESNLKYRNVVGIGAIFNF